MKRAFDILVGSAALILLAPVIVLTGLVVLFALGRPVFFRQMRAGLGGRDFAVLKFRTMNMVFGPDGLPLPDDARLTPIGRQLRRFRLDELPEFVQVVGGRMSFVGPRPLPRALLEERGVLKARCSVRPGLTGLAQVSGNTLLDNDEKFAIDLYYADNRTLMGDLSIILATMKTIVVGEQRDEETIGKALRHADGLAWRSR